MNNPALPTPHIEILICTHNRCSLLERTLQYLNQANRPQPEVRVSIFVVANACTDNTLDFLSGYSRQAVNSCLPLRYIEEPVPGKSSALNTAIGQLHGTVVAFVDDDHRVHMDYLTAITRVILEQPGHNIFCGQILPDWTGEEPAWIHGLNPYRIYPLPVPKYSAGNDERLLGESDGLPGGGNWVMRREIFSLVEGFSTDLGPKGHDLGGAEDFEFLNRCTGAGESVYYSPTIIQYHYVDLKRLKLGYLIRKSFQRSQALIRVRNQGTTAPRIPLYLWRKLFAYGVRLAGTLYWPATRFYLVRVAATLGEISAYRKIPKAR